MTEEITNEEVTYRNKLEKEIRELTDKYRDLLSSPTIGSMLILFGALMIADEALNEVKKNLKKYKEKKDD